MTAEEAIDRINELLGSTDPETANTSMRIPKALREAAALAVNELGVAPSTTVLAANALRNMLEGTVALAALELHFEQYPEARPTLADLAVVAAEWDDSPLAQRPELLRRYAEGDRAAAPATPSRRMCSCGPRRASTPQRSRGAGVKRRPAR